MTVQKPLDFILINDLADNRSMGRVVSQITSWWKDKTGTVWGGRPLKKLVPANWFKLHTQCMPMLWTHPPAAI